MACVIPIEDISSGSSGRVRGGPRNMKSMRPPSAAIFFMTYFHRAGGGAMAPSAPPGSATGYAICITFHLAKCTIYHFRGLTIPMKQL